MVTTGTHIGRPGVLGAAAAAGVNLALFAGAKAAGVEFIVGTEAQRSAVAAGHVVVSSVLAVLVGTLIAMLARERRRLRALQVAALAIAAVSLGGPLSMGAGTGAKVTLALMHVVVAAAFAAALQVAIRERQATAAASAG